MYLFIKIIKPSNQNCEIHNSFTRRQGGTKIGTCMYGENAGHVTMSRCILHYFYVLKRPTVWIAIKGM